MGNSLALIRCAEKSLDTLLTAVDDGDASNDLLDCGPDLFKLLKSSHHESDYQKRGQQLAYLVALSHGQMTSVHHSQVQLCWRRLYTDATIALIASAILNVGAQGEGNIDNIPDPDWKNWIRGLDMIIIIAGAPGEGRLEMVYDLIFRIQACYGTSTSLPSGTVAYDVDPVSDLPSYSLPVPRLSKPPSLASFPAQATQPFVLPGWTGSWPALNNHPWSSAEYLLRASGPGRVVPVEIGADYTRDDWTQELMDWEEFLRRIGMLGGEQVPGPPVYLAQHDLLRQFPKLRADIDVPDYVYSAAGQENPDHRPPGNEEELVINVWLGPRGTVSPAHTDPYYNLYTQVVGRKIVWLAPPTCSEYMLPIRAPDHTVSQPVKPASSTSLENTSSLDIFSEKATMQPLFRERVLPQSMCCVLEPGDTLSIPPGWWHAMRSEDISMSVSMWF